MISRGSSYFPASSSSTSSAVDGWPVGVLRSTGSPSLPNSTSCNCFGDSSENGPPAAACACASISRMRAPARCSAAAAARRRSARRPAPSAAAPARAAARSLRTAIAAPARRRSSSTARRCSCSAMSAFSAAYCVALSSATWLNANLLRASAGQRLRSESYRRRDTCARPRRCRDASPCCSTRTIRASSRSACRAARCLALEHVRVVLDVMSDLRAAARSRAAACSACSTAVDARAARRAGIVVAERHVRGAAGLDAEGDADDVRLHVVERSRFDVRTRSARPLAAARSSAADPPS